MSDKKIVVRKHKNFTGIYLQEITESAFIESRKKLDELYQSGEKYVVIRINKKAYQEFFSTHSETFDNVNTNDEISFLGTTYKVLDVNDSENDGLAKIGYFKRDINDTKLNETRERKWQESFMWGNIARSFLEHSFQNTTGTMLFC